MISKIKPAPQPKVIAQRVFTIQVCVPKGWTDEQVEQFANSAVPPGTSAGWKVRQVEPIRVQCEEDPTSEKEHLVLTV